MYNCNEYMRKYMRKKRSGKRVCKNCKKDFNLLSGVNKHKFFCNDKCYKEHRYNTIKSYQQNHPIKTKKQHKKYFSKIKLELFNILGNKCVCCGENIIDFLVIDHVKSNGAQDRSKNNVTYLFILKKVKSGSKDYQLLCANCNRGKNSSKVKFCPVHHPELYK